MKLEHTLCEKGQRYKICVFLTSLLMMALTIAVALSFSDEARAYNNYDNPSCFWPYTPGQRKTLLRKWGNWVDYEWKTAYNTSVTDWNQATDRVYFHCSENTQNAFNMYYCPGCTHGGYVTWHCSGSTMTKSTAWVNDAHDPGTRNRRRKITGHELGHVISLGHSVVYPSLMGPNDPATHYTPQADDINGVLDRFSW